MQTTFKHRKVMDTTEGQREATKRMALFPERAEVLFVGSEMWVVSPFSLDDDAFSHFFEKKAFEIALWGCGLLACRSLGRKTLCIPRHTTVVPGFAGWTHKVLAVATGKRETSANTNIHDVRPFPSLQTIPSSLT
jgi:hypothetical protein